MLDDNALEQLGRDMAVPHAVGIHHDNGSTRADAEARSLTSLHTTRAEEQPFPIEQRGQSRVELTAPSIRSTESTHAHQHVTRVRLKKRLVEFHGLYSAFVGSYVNLFECSTPSRSEI